MITGNDIKTIRLALRETQTKFAARLGLSHYQRVVELEQRGDERVPAITEIKILDAGLSKYLKPGVTEKPDGKTRRITDGKT